MQNEQTLKPAKTDSQTSSRAIFKLLAAIMLISAEGYLFYHYLYKRALLQLTADNYIPLPTLILTIFCLFIAVMTIDLIYKKAFSLFIAPAVYLVTFFTANDALWSAELLWNKNYLLILSILAIYSIVLCRIIYRAAPDFRWMYKRMGAKSKEPVTTWPMLSSWNKLLTLLGITALIIITVYVPYKVILTSGYLVNEKAAQKQATVLGTGESRGKNFYHRYWEIELDGKPLKFWVYAAARTQPAEKQKCATHTDPEPGSTLLISGREGVFGFSYDKVLQIRDPKGVLICQE